MFDELGFRWTDFWTSTGGWSPAADHRRL